MGGIGGLLTACWCHTVLAARLAPHWPDVYTWSLRGCRFHSYFAPDRYNGVLCGDGATLTGCLRLVFQRPSLRLLLCPGQIKWCPVWWRIHAPIARINCFSLLLSQWVWNFRSKLKRKDRRLIWIEESAILFDLHSVDLFTSLRWLTKSFCFWLFPCYFSYNRWPPAWTYRIIIITSCLVDSWVLQCYDSVIWMFTTYITKYPMCVIFGRVSHPWNINFLELLSRG